MNFGSLEVIIGKLFALARSRFCWLLFLIFNGLLMNFEVPQLQSIRQYETSTLQFALTVCLLVVVSYLAFRRRERRYIFPKLDILLFGFLPMLMNLKLASSIGSAGLTILACAAVLLAFSILRMPAPLVGSINTQKVTYIGALISVTAMIMLYFVVLHDSLTVPRLMGLFLTTLVFSSAGYFVLEVIWQKRGTALIFSVLLGTSLVAERNAPSSAVPFEGYESHLRSISHDWDSDNTEYWNANNDLLGDRYSVAFDEWIFDRSNALLYRENSVPYPVFIVAAEGGGGYAMAHSRYFLNSMSTRCKNFFQHTFSLVGVSGGSVGNSVAYLENDFHEELIENEGCSSTSTVDITADLAKDNLTPVVAYLLFVEFPRRFFYLPVAEKNRSEVLTASVLDEVALVRPTLPEAPFSQHYWNYKPTSDDVGYSVTRTGGPALVSVSTNVDTGNRFVFSPFRFSSEAEMSYNFYSTTETLRGDSDRQLMHFGEVSFAEAVASSASFPWVTPSIRYDAVQSCERADDFMCAEPEEPRLRQVNLVDGGYFEGTGVETLGEIYTSISGGENDPRSEGTDSDRSRFHPFCNLLVDSEKCKTDRALALEHEILEYVDDGDDIFSTLSHDDPGVRYAFRRGVKSENQGNTRSFENLSGCTEIAAIHTTETDRVDWPPCTIVYRVTVIVLRDESSATRVTSGQSFLFDPIKTMFATRVGRGELAIERIEERICNTSHESCSLSQFEDHNGSFSSAVQNGMIEFRINSEALGLPLGWDMPTKGIQAMTSLVVPNADACDLATNWSLGVDETGTPIFDEQITENPMLASIPETARGVFIRNCNGMAGLAMILDPETLGEIDWFMWLD